MHILKTNEQAAKERGYNLEDRTKANEGCHECPFCKERVLRPKDVCIVDGCGYKDYLVDVYECPSCGAQWRSEPYYYGNDISAKYPYAKRLLMGK